MDFSPKTTIVKRIFQPGITQFTPPPSVCEGRLIANCCPLCCIIPVSPGLFALVDPEDWIELRQYKWRVLKAKFCYYAVRRAWVDGKRKTIWMHHEVVGRQPGNHVHHKNLNTMDNRKLNLPQMSPHEHKELHKALRIAKKHQMKRGCTTWDTKRSLPPVYIRSVM